MLIKWIFAELYWIEWSNLFIPSSNNENVKYRVVSQNYLLNCVTLIILSYKFYFLYRFSVNSWFPFRFSYSCKMDAKMFILKFYCSVKVDASRWKLHVLLIVQLDKYSDMECLMTQQKRFIIEDGIQPTSIIKLLVFITFMSPKFHTNSTFYLYRLKIIF